MRTMTMFMALASLMWPGVAAGQEARARTIDLQPVVGRGLDPALATMLPGLVEASLESAEGYEVVAGVPSAGWELALKVAGRGPWVLTARASARVGGVARGRVTIKRIAFADREGLIRAVESLAAQLHASLKVESPTGLKNAGGPIPLARALSSSTRAVEAYIRALSALRSADAAAATVLFDEALSADPAFVMAAAQRVRLALAAGRFDDARILAERAQAKSVPDGPALATDLIRTLRLVAGGDGAGALREADVMLTTAPHLLWGHVLKALALCVTRSGKEAVSEWNVVLASDPQDVAHRAMLGWALMASGEFKPAADVLGKARAAWPSNLILYTLQAESHARARDTEAARGVILAMRDYMLQHDLTATEDALNPYLLLGSVDLLEGRFKEGLAEFEQALDMKTKSGEPFGPTATLYETVIEMRRDLVTSYDELTRTRQLDDIQKLLGKFKDSLSPEERQRRESELLRLEGLITLKRGDPVNAWKLVQSMKARSGQPGYNPYDEAYLSAATAMKEDDLNGALANFERATKARGILVDFMDLGDIQRAMQKFDEAHTSLDTIEKGLSVYAPAIGPGAQATAAADRHDDLILADPHLAAMVPIYHYLRARLAFETGRADESRKHFNRMLKYLKNPDEQFTAMVKEAVGRGAKPE